MNVPSALTDNYHQLSDTTIDPTTGFITSNQTNSFDPQRKLEFIRFYRTNFNITKCCELLKVNRMTVMYHLQNDIAFKKAFQEAREGIVDTVEEVRMHQAMTPRGAFDRDRVLEQLRPEVWARRREQQQMNITIQLDGKAIEDAELRSKSIDVEQ